jgi:hypothetical protein
MTDLAILSKNSIISLVKDKLDTIIEKDVQVRIEGKGNCFSLSPYSDKIGVKNLLRYYMGKEASVRENKFSLSIISLTGEDRGFLSLDFDKVRVISLEMHGDWTAIRMDELTINFRL